MPFFNPNPESPDLQRLPAGIRRDEELSVLAAECEAAVLAAFTITLASPVVGRAESYPIVSPAPTGAYALDATYGVYLCLRGYDPDPTLCAAALAEALRQEIASVIRWRRAGWRADPLTQTESSSDGTKVVSYRDDKNAPFPQHFGMYLRPYDVRPPATVI